LELYSILPPEDLSNRKKGCGLGFTYKHMIDESNCLRQSGGIVGTKYRRCSERPSKRETDIFEYSKYGPPARFNRYR
jgi:hypothetical protein